MSSIWVVLASVTPSAWAFGVTDTTVNPPYGTAGVSVIWTSYPAETNGPPTFVTVTVKLTVPPVVSRLSGSAALTTWTLGSVTTLGCRAGAVVTACCSGSTKLTVLWFTRGVPAWLPPVLRTIACSSRA